MNKIFRAGSLITINGAMMYLIYAYIETICSTKMDNFLHVLYQPSGMQWVFYFITLPFFMVLSALSAAHSYYCDLRKSLVGEGIVIWFSYVLLLLFVHLVMPENAQGPTLLYYGSLLISCVSIAYIIYITCTQFAQLYRGE